MLSSKFNDAVVAALMCLSNLSVTVADCVLQDLFKKEHNMHQHLLDLGLPERLLDRDASMASGQSALAPSQQNKIMYCANTSN